MVVSIFKVMVHDSTLFLFCFLRVTSIEEIQRTKTKEEVQKQKKLKMQPTTCSQILPLMLFSSDSNLLILVDSIRCDFYGKQIYHHNWNLNFVFDGSWDPSSWGSILYTCKNRMDEFANLFVEVDINITIFLNLYIVRKIFCFKLLIECIF